MTGAVSHGRAHPTAEWIARQLTEAYGWEQAPQYLIRDRDRVYGAVVTRHLRHLLLSYKTYYNETRTHLSLNKDAPSRRAVQATGRILRLPILGGLHHQYGRI